MRTEGGIEHRDKMSKAEMEKVLMNSKQYPQKGLNAVLCSK